MNKSVAFWDSSVLVPLCVTQVHTNQARLLFTRYSIAVWWATPVEIVSAFTRLVRMGDIDPNEMRAARQDARALAGYWRPVLPTAAISDRACTLLESYSLTAADALQLAAALAWCDNKPAGQVFLTFDARLAEAASKTGFTLGC